MAHYLIALFAAWRKIMRKMRYLCFATALFLIVGFGAFAQSGTTPATISMWNRGVFNLYQSDGNTSVGPNWMGYSIPQGAYNGLTLYYAIKDVSWTMTAEWEGDWTVVDFTKTTLSEFSGSYRMFNGFARLTAGKVRSDGGYRFINFDTAGFSTRIANAETGVLLTIQPVRGLSIGTFLPVPVAAQAASTTYQHMNFGASYDIPKLVTFKTSYRMEPISAASSDPRYKSREFAIGAQLIAVPNFLLTIGYRWLDLATEHDFFLDTSYRFPSTHLSAFAYVSLQNAVDQGFKVNIEQLIGKSPFVIGASVSWGTKPDLWWLDGWDGNPYIRYDFGGSSVQLGMDFTYTTAFAYKVQLAYTIGF
jgi:hypothetical protein